MFPSGLGVSIFYLSWETLFLTSYFLLFPHLFVINCLKVYSFLLQSSLSQALRQLHHHLSPDVFYQGLSDQGKEKEFSPLYSFFFIPKPACFCLHSLPRLSCPYACCNWWVRDWEAPTLHCRVCSCCFPLPCETEKPAVACSEHTGCLLQHLLITCLWVQILESYSSAAAFTLQRGQPVAPKQTSALLLLPLSQELESCLRQLQDPLKSFSVP